MQVVAFCSPLRPDWRWRIVNYAGEMVEESNERFPSISTAVTEGTRRLTELNVEDVSDRTHSFSRGFAYRRRNA